MQLYDRSFKVIYLSTFNLDCEGNYVLTISTILFLFLYGSNDFFFLAGFSRKPQRVSLCRNVVNTYLTLNDKNLCMEFLLVARIYIFWCPRRTLAFRDFARADGDHPIRDDTPACSATNQMFSGLAFPIF